MLKEYCEKQIKWLEETCAEFRSETNCDDNNCDKCGIKLSIEAFYKAIKSEDPNIEKIKWNKVKFRPLSEEEKANYPEWVTEIFDCPLPDHGEDILVQTKFRAAIDVDTFYHDFEHGCGGEKYDDWKDIVAWAKMPKGIS